ncbi:phage terminase large subunit [Phreatobacter sp. HK31-P]
MSAPVSRLPARLDRMEAALQWQAERAEAEHSLSSFTRQGWRHAGEPASISWNWHIDCINEHLEAVLDRQIKRVIFNIPPRHMKSLGGNVFMPAYTWAQNPDPDKTGHGLPIRPGTWRGPGTKFMSLSYDSTLTTRDSVKCRLLLESDWYQDRWGDRVTLRTDQNQKTYYENTHGGHRWSSSMGGRITGHGGDIIVIDDPHNVREGESSAVREEVLRTWDEALPTRLNDPETGAFIVIMQRIHERDLVGHILAKELGATLVDLTEENRFTAVCLPALAEPDHPVGMKTTVLRKGTDEVWADRREPGEVLWASRFPQKVLSPLFVTLGSYAAAGQLQQRPAPREGGKFSRSMFPIVPSMPLGVVKRVRSWDLAGTEAAKSDPDWTAGVKMAQGIDGYFYVEHVHRFRANPHEVRVALKSMAGVDPAGTTITLPQDPGQAGKFQVLDFARALAGYTFQIIQPTGSKDVRSDPFAAQCEAGNVRLVAGHWNDAFIDEFIGFPTASHDDQVDATADAFNTLMAGFSGSLTGQQRRN